MDRQAAVDAYSEVMRKPNENSKWGGEAVTLKNTSATGREGAT